MRLKMKEMEGRMVDFEQQQEIERKRRRERIDRQNALQWMRTLLFPFIEEQASARNMSLSEATAQIVAQKTRIDMLLRQHWNDSALQGMLDNPGVRMLIQGNSGLLNETDDKTAEGAKWLLHTVLPEDPEGLDIQQAFLKDEQLWVETIVGLKKLFASRIMRQTQPLGSGAVRRF
jgi:chemotaxis regulatin CheY-phosphate phosphatase CheZ